MAQVITTILLDNNPKGLRLIEMANWSGLAFVIPRSKLKEFKERPEASCHGIYFLFGEGKEKPSLYIGQSSNIVNRLTSHDTEKAEDDWNEAFVFLRSLDSTLIHYLESKAVHFAVEAKRYEISNGNIPHRAGLSEAQNIIAAEYFEKIKLIVALNGYPVFTNPQKSQESSATYTFKVDKAIAKGKILETQEFVVFKGSSARIAETDSFGKSGRALRQRLVVEGILIEDSAGNYIFTNDYLFNSPSAAADTVAGRSCNGWTSWKDEKDNTLDINFRK